MAVMSPGILVLALMFGTSSWSALPLGMPPGERDAALMRTPADGCLVYLEWASRSSGKGGRHIIWFARVP